MIPMPSGGCECGSRRATPNMRRGMQGLALQVQERVQSAIRALSDLYIFPRAQRRLDEDPLARWPRAIAGCEAARPRKVHLAIGEGGCRFDLGRADGLHARNRLAESATDLEAGERGLSAMEAPAKRENMGSDAFWERLQIAQIVIPFVAWIPPQSLFPTTSLR